MKQSFFSAIAISFLLSNSALAAVALEARAAGGSYEVKLDGDKIKIDNTGFDLRAKVDATPEFSIRAQINSLKGDEASFNGDTGPVDTTTTTIRLGGAYDFTTVGANGLFFGAAEYGHVKTKASASGSSGSDSDSGILVSVGFHDAGKTTFLWSVELGAVALKDSKGATFDATLGYRFSPNWALVGGVQSYALTDNESDADITFGIATIGVRAAF